ncbi:MAG TPA: 30S ribosomal protein S12 methylthiotransferase RimO [Sutterella sp.]|nr:30S ribosomal protein S12 methylthiotransferase RimO [Sutterella sp.]
MNHVPRIGFVSLGCPKALVDTETIVGRLKTLGYDTAPDFTSADLVIVNTCGFLNESVAESLEAIEEALQENGKVIVTGCLGARKNPDNTDFVTTRLPKVLGVTRPGAFDEVISLVQKFAPIASTAKRNADFSSLHLTPAHYAYLKISEGCSHHCTYCIIPKLRGPLVSTSVRDNLLRAQRLVQSGVRELLVVSQDTAAYGADLKFVTGFDTQNRPTPTRILNLCERLAELNVWVRLHYVYPYPQVDALVELMAQGKILPYLDVPLQHAHPRVLKAMKRPGDSEKTLERILTWRRICPDIAIRSTFIAGFPGETESEFQYLLDFIKEAQLDRVGCFAYSPIDGAAANDLYEAIPDEVRLDRRERFMALQSQISETKLKNRIGQTLEVMIDEPEDDEGVAVGRTKYDAPEIDGLTYVTTDRHLNPGDIVNVQITRTEGPDLVGKAL